MEASNCCGALPTGETHEGLGFCSECRDHEVFEEMPEDDYLLGDGFLNEFTRDVVVPFAKAYNKIDKKKEK